MEALSKQKIVEAVIAFLADRSPAAFRDASMATPLAGDGKIDSVGTLDLVHFVEERFAVELDDEDLTDSNFATLGSLADLIMRRAKIPAAGV
ncbi:MAG: acyl carrier protein [Alphaproteobacteria bacterium]|nr:acyl carrier protein [Alphaproteobacteria bacterium]